MKKRMIAWLAVVILCLGTVIPASAANTFAFTKKAIELWEGETGETELRREGKYTGGEVTYTSGSESVATVAEDGTVTAVGKGQTKITATLRINGKKAAQTAITVKVKRAVKKVTLDTTKLSVYDSDHPFVAELLRKKPGEGKTKEYAGEEADEEEEEVFQVLVIPAGTAVTLAATCTPEDASDRHVDFTTSDAGVAKVTRDTLKAIQRGECDLTVASVQNPEVTETFRVLVIQPVKKIEIDAGDKKVAAGDTAQLTARCSPANATIQDVEWSSKNPDIATVDENGVVTGLKRGTAGIVAKAADGSGTTGVVSLTVTQPVTAITFGTQEVAVVAGKTAGVKPTVWPADASDKTVSWSSSDETVATVKNGQIAGHKAGICTVTCTSNSDPDVWAELTVTVSQLVTRIENINPQADLTLKVGETVETDWSVLPSDATNKGMTFKSQQPKVATVDSFGVVTAVGRGVATIVATAADGSKKQGTVKITVIQPVTGVSIPKDLYYIQRGTSATLRAVVEPRNANNQKVYWSSEDERIATVRSNGTSTGSVYGVSSGTTTVTAWTDDGGFTASTRVRIGNFNEAVMVEELYVDERNNIRISLRNMTTDITLENICYTIECYDMQGYPMICNRDGESTSFTGDYPSLLEPLERTVHGAFRFRNYVIPDQLGAVILTVTGWTDADGITWTIPESERIPAQWTRMNLTPYHPVDDGDVEDDVGYEVDDGPDYEPDGDGEG